MQYWRRRKPTSEEIALAQALKNLRVQVLSQVKEGRKHIDLAIPSAKINIEVDGKYHLTDPHQIIKDLSRKHFSDKLGYETVHIPNEYIHTDLERIAKALAGAAVIREKQVSQGIIK
jgi:very-short-patch-repair endonuclease